MSQNTVDPRTVAALRGRISAWMDEEQLCALVKAIAMGGVPGLTTCDLPPEPLPVGQVRRDPVGRYASRGRTILYPWQYIDNSMSGFSDDHVRDWDVVWTPGDEVLKPGHVQVQPGYVSTQTLEKWAAAGDEIAADRAERWADVASAVLYDVAKAELDRRQRERS